MPTTLPSTAAYRSPEPAPGALHRSTVAVTHDADAHIDEPSATVGEKFLCAFCRCTSGERACVCSASASLCVRVRVRLCVSVCV